MNPIISVVIPTYNRAHLLSQLLESLYEQTISKEQYEIILINDGSKDNTEEVAFQFQNKASNFRYLQQQNQGPAAARNLGVSFARGEYIAFTDDDCIVHNDWLFNILNAFKKNIIGVQGRTYTDREKTSALTHQIDNENGSNAVPTCNAAFKKSTIEQIKGFDESFPYPHNEDADFAWRISEFGEIAFDTNVLVYHPPRLEKFSKLKRRMKIMESEFLLYYKSKKNYQHNRNKTPWHTIYKEVFIKHLIIKFILCIKLINRPYYMLQCMALIGYWWFSLIILFPKFWRANYYHKSTFSS